MVPSQLFLSPSPACQVLGFTSVFSFLTRCPRLFPFHFAKFWIFFSFFRLDLDDISVCPSPPVDNPTTDPPLVFVFSDIPGVPICQKPEFTSPPLVKPGQANPILMNRMVCPLLCPPFFPAFDALPLLHSYGSFFIVFSDPRS